METGPNSPALQDSRFRSQMQKLIVSRIYDEFLDVILRTESIPKGDSEGEIAVLSEIHLQDHDRMQKNGRTHDIEEVKKKTD